MLLITILEEAYQTLIILEHDPNLFEDASEMAEYVGQALKETSNGSSVLMYSPWTNRHFEEISKFAYRVFVFNEVHKYVYKRASQKTKPGPIGQRTFEAFRYGSNLQERPNGISGGGSPVGQSFAIIEQRIPDIRPEAG